MSDQQQSSPLPRPLRFLAAPLAAGYSRIIGSRNAAFDAGRGVVEIDRPVISVGNLSVGGTGKTPMVTWIVDELREEGHRPVIAMRGYSKGGASDEAEEYRARFPHLSIVAQANRLEGLLEFFQTPEGEKCDCVILDDGFQHRRIARQLEIVLLDATRNPFTDLLLPAGWLREPVESLRRADFVVLTHAECAGANVIAKMIQEVTRVAPQARLAVSSHMWADIAIADQSGERREEIDWLRGKRVVAACGIGNPGPFVRAVKDATGTPLKEFLRPDHDPIVPQTLAELVRVAREFNADAIVVTGKDWSKLKHVRHDAWPCPIVRPRLELSFERGEEEIWEAFFDVVDPPELAREQ